jgi:hypothetical protein
MLDKLARRTMGPLSLSSQPDQIQKTLHPWGSIGDELASLLILRDGFYSHESALLVRPFQHAGEPLGIVEWNDRHRWSDYPGTDNLFFFSEDVFGHPFALSKDGIVTLDLETGDVERVAESLEAWAALINDDANLWTGWTLAHDWQERFGAIPVGQRLVPKQPFVLGGEYTIDNLIRASDEDGLSARARLATQIRTSPVGSEILYELRPAR